MKQKNKKGIKRLPPEPKRENPFSSIGAGRPLIIAIVALAAVLALTLLLLFSDKFVGKATADLFDQTKLNTVGIELVSSPVVHNQPFFVKVMANTNQDIAGVSLTILNLPPGISCTSIDTTSLDWDFELKNDCLADKVVLELAAVTKPAQSAGVFEIAQIGFTGAPSGDHVLDLKVDLFEATLFQLHPVTVLQPTINVQLCGNNVIDPAENEQCDGIDLDEKECGDLGLGFTGGTLACLEDCSGFETSGCTTAECSLTKDCPPGEMCVNGVCIVQAVCGNGVIDIDPADPAGAEQCDDDNTADGDGCSSTCMIEDGWTAVTCPSGPTGPFPASCFTPFCGDGLIVGDEICDGSDLGGKACGDLGFIGGTLACDSECNYDTSAYIAAPTCGDGNVDTGEDCSTCLADVPCATGETCESGVCVAAVSPVCGDGNVDPGELCDDGNTANLDGCDENCVNIEFGWKCIGTPSVCSTTCGDGAVGVGSTEQCDDGNTVSGDGCDNLCQTEIVIQEGETVNGTKITLTDLATVNDVFSTIITATEDFTETITIYTILYGTNELVLAIKSEKVIDGLDKDETYTAYVNYPETDVVKKSVLVYDVEQNPTVFGQLEKSYS